MVAGETRPLSKATRRTLSQKRADNGTRTQDEEDGMNREHVTFSAGTFGDSPTPLALVCVTCGAEVALVDADDLAAMDELPGHDCKGTVAA